MKKRPGFLEAAPFRIVAIYAAVSFLWIYFSDMFLGLLVHDPQFVTFLSVFKGSLFVVVTASLLYLFIRRDILKIVERERALRASEERFKAIATNTPDHVLIQDKDLRYTFVLNPQLGLRVEDMIGKTDLEILHSQDAEPLIRIKRDVIESAKAVKMPVPLVSSTGKTEYFDGAYVPKLDENGNVDGLIGYFRNVTEQKRIEKEIRESSERFRSLFEGSGIGMAFISLEGRFLQVNPAFCRYLGYSEQEILNKTVTDITYPDDRAITVEAVSQIMSQSTPIRKYEKRYLHKSGEVRWGEINATAVCDSNGKPMYAISQIIDITERRHAELALKQAKENAEEANKVKSDFLNNIAHDFRTPIHAIMGFSSFLQKEDLTEKQRKFVDIISGRGQNLLRLVEDLLDVSRLQSGHLPLRSMEFDLKDCVSGVCELSRAALLDKDVKLSFVVDDGIPRVNGDLTRIEQVLANLLGNAVKYTDRGEIAVHVQRDQKNAPEGKCRVRISVKDTGLGIPQDKQMKIFDAFARFHEFEGGQDRGGVGLGLYIVKTLVDMMGGQIVVASEEGVGSEFVVTLDLDPAG